MKNGLYIGCVCMLLGWMVSCSKEQTPGLQEGKASLTLEVATSAVSRATAPGDGDLYKGGGMEDLTVVLVNSSNVIAAKRQVTGLTGDEQKVKVVTIDEGLEVGNYMLYVFANTENASLSEAKNLLDDLEVDNTWNATDELFTTLTGTEVPSMDNTKPLLLTAQKQVSLGIKGNKVTIDLLRPVVWFQVKLYNHSEKDMTVSALSFSDFNPSTGYLLPHDGAVPTSVSYRSLPAYGGGKTVEAGANDVVYDIALFENECPDGYMMDMTLQTEGTTMTNTTTLETKTQYALKNSSTGNYLVDNNGTLGVASYSGVVPDVALWTFSGTNSGYLTNVGSTNKFYREVKKADSGSDLTFQSYKIYYTTSSGRWQTSYYLTESNGSVSYKTGTSNNQWQLQIITTATVDAQLKDAQLKTVNPETGAAIPMTRQIRNQHITVTVNAYYNEQEGAFNFEVEPWTEKNAEVEFN